MPTASVSVPILDSGDSVVSYTQLTLNTATAQSSATLQNGSTVYAWSTAPYFISQRVNFSIYGMIVGPSGVASQPFLIATAPTSRYGDHLYYSPSLAPLSNGGFVAVYDDSASSGINRGIFLRKFDSSGSPTTGQLLVGKDSWGGGLPTAVTVLTDSSFRVSWTGSNGTQTVTANEPSFSLVADVATPTEGGVASFVLSASTAAASAVVDYSILGIQANDTTINLTGTISVGSDGKARLSVPLVIDGQTENESITVTALGFSVTVPITDVSQSNTSPQIVTPVCFALGTLIQTASGPVPVEELQIGDRLSFYVTPTLIDSAKVKWIGRQTFHPVMAELVDYLPIRISANALGPGQPFRDLYVSPDHAILFDGTLIHAKVLVNGTSVVQMTEWSGDVEYFHIETENHELVYANGVPAETFIDNVSRRQFDNYAEFEAMYPNVPMMAELDIPRVLFRRQLSTASVQRLNALEEVWDARYRPTDVATESV